MNCPKCNQSVPANARFCGSCGQQIEAASASASSAVAPIAAPSLLGAHAAATGSKAWTAAAASAPGLISRVAGEHRAFAEQRMAGH